MLTYLDDALGRVEDAAVGVLALAREAPCPAQLIQRHLIGGMRRRVGASCGLMRKVGWGWVCMLLVACSC